MKANIGHAKNAREQLTHANTFLSEKEAYSKIVLARLKEGKLNEGVKLNINPHFIDTIGVNRDIERNSIEFVQLKHSISELGILQPIVLHFAETGEFLLVAGHRRLEAAKDLGLEFIPAIYTSDIDSIPKKRFAENAFRKDYKPVEFCEQLAILKETYDYSVNDLVELTKKTRQVVGPCLKIASWDEKQKNISSENKIPLTRLVDVAKKKEANINLELSKIVDELKSDKRKSENLERKKTTIEIPKYIDVALEEFRNEFSLDSKSNKTLLRLAKLLDNQKVIEDEKMLSKFYDVLIRHREMNKL